jgi:hypothetical protein
VGRYIFHPVNQGTKLAVSRYPRDTRFYVWILNSMILVSQRDTKKISRYSASVCEVAFYIYELRYCK